MASPYIHLLLQWPLFGNGHDLHISSYASISKKSYSSPGWTYIHHSLLSTLVASPSRSQPEVSIFNVMKLKYFTEILKGK